MNKLSCSKKARSISWAIAFICAAYVGSATAQTVSFREMNVSAQNQSSMQHSSQHSYVLTQIDKINSEESKNARSKYTEDLADWVNAKNMSKVSDGDIDAMAQLLIDKDDSVRYWTAMALGHLGRRAARAVPELQEALNAIACVTVDGMVPESSSAPAIRYAFSQIGVTPGAVPCK